MLQQGEKMVLVLQGGGALGAYQAGAYQALSEAGIEPDWVAGISIGAINSALIAGNKPEHRVARLRKFWEGICGGVAVAPWGGTEVRGAINEANAARVAAFGVPGFFTPRLPPAVFLPAGSPGATSFYTTEPLKQTLCQLVDFDILNSGRMRYSAGAVEITSGNFAYFDSTLKKISVDHVMASGALPPGFPPIVIEGKSYWDGGLVSNTPMQYVLEMTGHRDDTCLFQVDLFSAHGPPPQSLPDVARREKEIRFSSRTRLNTDNFEQMQTLRRAVRRLLRKLPPDLLSDSDAQICNALACNAAVTIVHLIHRRAAYDRYSMDYEFSRVSMLEHWDAGYRDVQHTLNHPAWKTRQIPAVGVTVLDLTREEEGDIAKGA